MVDTLRYYAAIEWLFQCQYLHRDISDGNILLAQEEPSVFIDPETREFLFIGRNAAETMNNTIHLYPRKPHNPPQVFGLLHDMDMAGVVESVSLHPVYPILSLADCTRPKACRQRYRDIEP